VPPSKELSKSDGEKLPKLPKDESFRMLPTLLSLRKLPTLAVDPFLLNTEALFFLADIAWAVAIAPAGMLIRLV
jgi:hypothetical protein